MSAFCETCEMYTGYKITEVTQTEEINGKKVTYKYVKPVCIECGQEVYVPGVDDENAKRAWDAYKKAYENKQQLCADCPHLKSAKAGPVSFRYWCGLSGDGYNGKALGVNPHIGKPHPKCPLKKSK